MEQELEKMLNDTIANENTDACLIANRQGLSVGARGNVSTHSSGIFVALLEHASQLEPSSNPPIVALESNKKTCVVAKHGITGVIIKNKTL